MNIDINNIKNIAYDDSYKKAKSVSLKYIEKSYKTEKQIADKLRIKGYEDITINKVIDFLKEYKFIYDDEFVKNYVKEKLSSIGRRKIEYNLLKKGISSDLIRETINSMDSDIEYDSAYNIGLKKYSILQHKELDKRKINQKLLQFLLGKGYTFDISKNAVKKILGNDVEVEFYE
jgi:regulatory protein